MKDENPIDLINESLHEHLEYKFKRAGLPMMKFHIHELENNMFYVTAMFIDDTEVSVKLKVVKMINERDLIKMVAKSGSLEVMSDESEEQIFSVLSSAVFRVLAQKASQLKAMKSGNNVDVGQLQRSDTKEYMSTSSVTFVDFENFDLTDIDLESTYIN